MDKKMDNLTNIEKQKFHKRHKKNIAIIFGLIIGLIMVSLLAISLGASSVNWQDVISVLLV